MKQNKNVLYLIPETTATIYFYRYTQKTVLTGWKYLSLYALENRTIPAQNNRNPWLVKRVFLTLTGTPKNVDLPLFLEALRYRVLECHTDILVLCSIQYQVVNVTHSSIFTCFWKTICLVRLRVFYLEEGF